MTMSAVPTCAGKVGGDDTLHLGLQKSGQNMGEEVVYHVCCIAKSGTIATVVE
jgi:hypothetical protein